MQETNEVIMKADLLLVLVCCVSFIKWMFLRTVVECCI